MLDCTTNLTDIQEEMSCQQIYLFIINILFFIFLFMLKRIFLFVLTNIVIIILGTIILSLLEVLLGINIRGTLHTSYVSLAIFALFYGFFASFVSLFLSRWMAKRAYHMTLMTEESLASFSSKEQSVYRLIASLAQKNDIRMPEVGIYQSPEINAFATGATKNTSLVAVSAGLLEKMNEDEIEGVVAHEMAHILNGDMVTMTLLQGVINAFVIFLSRAIAQIVSLTGRGDSE